MNARLPALVPVLLAATIALPVLAGGQPPADPPQIGASLHDKVSLEISAIPPEAMEEVLRIRPDFVVGAAERETKHGRNYLDIEGESKDGEIEFDLLQTPMGWQVVEIQRDLAMDQVPEIVTAALVSEAPDFQPGRIIESVQHGTGAVIYEFFAVDGDGRESLKEVRLEHGTATVLAGEKTH